MRGLVADVPVLFQAARRRLLQNANGLVQICRTIKTVAGSSGLLQSSRTKPTLGPSLYPKQPLISSLFLFRTNPGVIRFLRLQSDSECYKEICIGKSKFGRYSQKAIARIKKAVEEHKVERIWAQRGVSRT